MTPTVGRIVHYHLSHGAIPAIVTGTYSTPPDMVDLTTFPRGANPDPSKHSIREGTEAGCWSWPPRVEG